MRFAKKEPDWDKSNHKSEFTILTLATKQNVFDICVAGSTFPVGDIDAAVKLQLSVLVLKGKLNFHHCSLFCLNGWEPKGNISFSATLFILLIWGSFKYIYFTYWSMHLFAEIIWKVKIERKVFWDLWATLIAWSYMQTEEKSGRKRRPGTKAGESLKS